MHKGLAFFPWLTLTETLDLGEFSLVPYSRGKEPYGSGSPEQAECDDILEVYHETRVAPIRRATLLHRSGRDLTSPIRDEEAPEIAEWGELVAFAGLAARRYFSSLNYLSRESFRLMVVGYSDPRGGIQEWRRRRDGHANTIVSREVAQVVRPLHAYAAGRSPIDVPLLQALLKRRRDADWARYLEAIRAFNAASTDDPGVAEEFEVVAVIGAFERLCDLRSGDEAELATSLVSLLAITNVVSPSTSARLSASQARALHANRRCLTDVWIRDFFRQRGKYAHGRNAGQMPTVWSIREHLLLGSFLFPLAVKRLLAQDGAYSLAGSDQLDLNAAEELLNLKDLLASSPRPGETHPWNDVFERLHIDALARRIVDGFMLEQNGAEGASDTLGENEQGTTS